MKFRLTHFPPALSHPSFAGVGFSMLSTAWDFSLAVEMTSSLRCAFLSCSTVPS